MHVWEFHTRGQSESQLKLEAGFVALHLSLGRGAAARDAAAAAAHARLCLT